MTFLIGTIIVVTLIAIGWLAVTSSAEEHIECQLVIGKAHIDIVMYRLLESPEYIARSYSGRLDVLKNETRSLLEPLYKNLTCEECKYIRRGLGYHIARRAKLTIPTN